MDYVIIRKFLFILSRWHSQVGFPTCVTVKTPHLERSVSNDVVILLIMKFFTKSSRAVQVLVRSIKVSTRRYWVIAGHVSIEEPGDELCKSSKKIPEGMPWA
ncbi:hypothetical protein T01_7043 [Trichinella spiralis]|uniref:Uncharacterized protein n=1 Tax=Trichinella spiralis TaxID=6334 RepID=A0A0V1BMD1_TRISP|nr:hypothetical protein T01_7043 [Trichinella spiralis]